MILCKHGYTVNNYVKLCKMWFVDIGKKFVPTVNMCTGFKVNIGNNITQ